MLFRMVVENTDVDLDAEMAIQFKLTNPFFSDSNWNEAYSYGFDLPKTAKNYRLFYNKEDVEFSVRIYYKGILFVQGVLISKVTHNKIKCNVKEQGTDLRQKMEDTHFDDIYLGEVVICDEADTPTTKIDKWYDHMVQTTLTDPVDEGSHKFPKINVQGYSEQDIPSEMLNTIFDENRIVNPYVLSDFLKNQPIPASYEPNTDEKGQWLHTISPCIRIEWLVSKVLEYFNVNKINGRILDIPEFVQMFNFSAYVLDKVETSGSDNYNVHGLGFEFNDFLPDNYVIILFDMISQYFGAYYNVTGNELNVYLRDDIVNMKPIDMSRYAGEEFTREEGKKASYHFVYDVEESHLNYSVQVRFNPATSDLRIFTYEQTSTFGFGADEEVVITSVPLLSNYFLGVGLLPSYAAFLTNNYYDRIGWTEFNSYLSYRDFIRSPHYPDADVERTTTFHTGLLRGIYTTKNYLIDGSYNIIGEESVPHMYVCNYNTQLIAEEDEDQFASHIVTFGDSSIYIGGEDNAADKYHRRTFEFMANYREVVKNLQLPIHKLLELKKWKNPKHTINLKNLSFQGIVKDVTFTLHNSNGVSASTVTYAVENKVTGRDYNDDWSDDYLN